VALQQTFNVRLEEAAMEFARDKEAFVAAERVLLQQEMAAFALAKEASLRDLLAQEREDAVSRVRQQLQLQLAAETQRCDTLKSDFTQRNHFFAQERSALLTQIAQFDAKLHSLAQTKAQEIEHLQREHKEETALLHIKHEETCTAMQNKHVQELAQVSETTARDVEQRCTEEFEHRLAEQEEKYESQLSQWQSENQALVNTLEDTLRSLTQEVDALSRAKEDVEDQWFDAQRVFAAKCQEAAWAHWQLLVKSMQQRQFYTRMLAKQEENHQSLLDQAVEEAKKPVYEVITHLYRLGVYVHTWETQHIADTCWRPSRRTNTWS
jgi:hypothetical protein